MIVFNKTHQELKFLIFSMMVFLQIGVCSAQNHISGYVFSAKDSTAISGGTVYFEGTSLGVSTDDQGYFKIAFQKNNSSLIISSIGCESVLVDSQAIQENDTLPPIYLTDKLEELEPVYLEVDRMSREEKLTIFRREFLGDNVAAQSCRIINENTIKLKYIQSTNTLVATAKESLVITNEFFGYLLTYTLRDFKVSFKEEDTELLRPSSLHYHGYSFFKPLRRKTTRKQLRNRKKSYLGSSFHFMRSLYAHHVDENKFKIFYNNKEVPTYKYFRITEMDGLKEVELLIDAIFISYKGNKGSVLASKRKFTIDYSGHHAPPEAINLYGEMSKKRISELLPLDYEM